MQNDSDASNLSYYQSINSGVTPADTNEQNLQTINDLYLIYFMIMPDSFSQTGNLMDSADLCTTYNIASQCYLSGGPAVFLARSMYWTAIRDNSLPFNDDCISTDTSGRDYYHKPKISDSNYLFRVYPNPMDRENSLNVQCSENGEITFYDLLGQITYRGQLSIGINIFDCTQLSCDNSLVLYEAKMQSGKNETGKVIMLK